MSFKRKLLIVFCILIIIFIITISLFYITSNINKYKSDLTYDNDNNINFNKIYEDPKEIEIYDIEEGYLTVPYNTMAIKHNYNWNKLDTSKNQYVYNDDLYDIKFGIDVSSFQKNIDWKKVKNAGVDFVFIRMGYRGYGKTGKLVVDSSFEENLKQATLNGIDVGIYFFSQAITKNEAIEEANFVLEHIKNKNVTYPICFDLEKIKFDDGRANNLTADEITDIAISFCEKIKDAGYTPLIYGNAKTFTTKMRLEDLNGYKKWYADYQKNPLYPYDFSFWQYTETGIIDGITGIVDLNLQFINKK